MKLRNFFKALTKRVFLALGLVPYTPVYLGSQIGNPAAFFVSMSQLLSLIPGKIGIYLRASFYCLSCPNTSDDISIGFLTILSQRDTTIREGVYIGPQSNIGKCEVGAETLIGSGVHILSGSRQHSFNELDVSIRNQRGTYQKVIIGRDCWIGNNSVIMANISDHSVIAAGSVVVKDVVEIGAIMAGNPARKVGTRFKGSNIG